MIKITNALGLRPILFSETEILFNLMKEIYPPAYQHFWKDDGSWYVNSQYNKEHVLKELSDENAAYYFILFNHKIVGNFRFIWEEKLLNLSEKNQVKLHRIYIHQKTQGNGIGKQLVAWLEEKAIQKGYSLIWLDAMDAQPQAFQFYRNLGYIYKSHTFLPFELMHENVRKMSQIYKKLT